MAANDDPDVSAEDWLEAFARAAGVEGPGEAELAELLELASVAAHSSERRAAPVACWISARAGIEPARALRLARELEVPRADGD